MSGSSMHHLTLPAVVPTDLATNDLVAAGFWIRIGAVLIDYIAALAIQDLVFNPVFEFTSWWTDASRTSPSDLLVSVVVVYALTIGSYFVLFESSRFQGTPGKLLFGLKVTDLAGRRITPLRAWARFAAKQLTWLLAGTGYLLILLPPQRQSLHDRIARTRVVRLRRQLPETPPAGGESVPASVS